METVTRTLCLTSLKVMRDVDIDVYRYRQESYREIKRRESDEYMIEKYGTKRKKYDKKT